MNSTEKEKFPCSEAPRGAWIHVNIFVGGRGGRASLGTGRALVKLQPELIRGREEEKKQYRYLPSHPERRRKKKKKFWVKTLLTLYIFSAIYKLIHFRNKTNTC